MTKQILAHSKHGYIAVCKNCGNYQLSLGTTGMCLNYEEFMSFSEMVFEESKFPEEIEMQNLKSIQIPTLNDNIQVVLTYNELLHLKNILEEALVMIQVHNILEPKN